MPFMEGLSKHTSLNQAKFDSWAPSYEDKRFDFFRRMQKQVLSSLEISGDSAFLDIGCGTGWAVRQAAIMTGEQGAAYGVDLSARMIEKAKEAANGFKNVKFVQANAEELPFPDNFFDHIICTMSFHHYLHPATAMEEIARVLKPNGMVCIVDPTADSFVIRWADALIKRRQPDHVGFYSTSEFQELFQSSELHYVRSRRLVKLWLSAKAHFAEKR